MITVGSLFSGIGGIDYGLEKTKGFKTIWFCETDKYASNVLKKHWPEVPNLGDVTGIEWGGITRPDMLVGGFPCQDISNAGKRAGIDGEKSGLWKEYERAIRILRPRLILIENVSALTYRGLNVVLADLAESGYDAQWDCLPAAAVGAPHRRDRLFIVAYPKHDGLTPCKERGCSGTRSLSGGQEEPEKEEASFNRELERTSCVPEDVAHPNSKRCKESKHEERPRPETRTSEGSGSLPNTTSKGLERKFRTEPEGRRARLANCCEDASDTDSPRTAPSRANPRMGWKRESLSHFRETIGRDQWDVEPNVGRVAHGISKRVDRLRCLGNAVVPQVAEFVGLCILDKQPS
jgi:DNA (cytosine-5)-methyltransferase 1